VTVGNTVVAQVQLSWARFYRAPGFGFCRVRRTGIPDRDGAADA
jgi:hypothetical protein